MHTKPRVLGYDDLINRVLPGHPVQWLRNGRSGMVAALIPSYSVMADDGDVITVVQLVRPTKRERVRQSLLDESSWETIDEAAFEVLWRAEAEAAAARLDVEHVNLATGLLLPIWNKLPGDFVSVSRISDTSGMSYLGRHVAEADLGKLASTLGIAIDIDLDVPTLIAALARRGTRVQLPGTPLTLASVLVNGSTRIEIKDYVPMRLDWYKSLGCFTEIVSYKTRLFVPVDRAEPIIGELLA